VSHEINLSGGEITILKTIGLSGAAMAGKVLVERADDLETSELIDTLDGLLTMGYVLSNRPNIRSAEDVGRAFFRVNPSYAKELRDVMQPARRQAREQRERRRRS
jgi:hypothetical protein